MFMHSRLQKKYQDVTLRRKHVIKHFAKRKIRYNIAVKIDLTDKKE